MDELQRQTFYANSLKSRGGGGWLALELVHYGVPVWQFVTCKHA
jgi:hypothetical protein